MTVATLPVGVLVFLQAWARDLIPLWVAAAIVALTATSPLSLTLAIRATEKETAKPGYRQPTAEQIQRRERRASYVMVVALCLSMPVGGYLIDGLVGAAIFLALAVLGSVLTLWAHRRFWNR